MNSNKNFEKNFIKKQINLFEGEELIFFNKNALSQFKNILVFGGLFFIVGIFFCFSSYLIIIGVLSLPKIIAFIVFILSLYLILFATIFNNSLIMNYKVKYYITSKRIIKESGKGFIPFIKKKCEEITYNNVDFILLEESFNILIYYRDSKGNLTYNGEEKNYLHKKFRKLPYLKIFIEIKKGIEIQKQIINILKDVIPIKKHPYLEDLFIPILN